jgi:hypothetical protein
MESIESANNGSVGSAEQEATWVAITCGPNRYIALAIGTRKDIDVIHTCGGVLRCTEAFEFGNPVQTHQGPQGIEIGKIHYSTRLDSTLFKCPVQFNLAGSTLYYIEDLDKRGGDYDQYMRFIRSAKMSAEQAYKDRVSRSSGIIAATSGAVSRGGANGPGNRGY